MGRSRQGLRRRELVGTDGPFAEIKEQVAATTCSSARALSEVGRDASARAALAQ
ncbi:MAG TPA: hypothetical protein VME46_09600 [Acidimicrobiales bacterium]|nr:hypothetical protein [Acidimicrobiales bacterium]